MSILNIAKEKYSVKEWSEREEAYSKAILKIVLPESPTSRDIQKLTADIDRLLTVALIDAAYVRRKYQRYETQMKLAEKEYFSQIKKINNDEIAIDKTKPKYTETEVKGLVVKRLKTDLIFGNKVDIYTLVQNTEFRLGFIEMVVKVLQEKKGALITDVSMIKIENGLSAA